MNPWVAGIVGYALGQATVFLYIWFMTRLPPEPAYLPLEISPEDRARLEERQRLAEEIRRFYAHG